MLLRLPWTTSLEWINRHCNLVADKLAKLASIDLAEKILWDDPSTQVVHFSNFDIV